MLAIDRVQRARQSDFGLGYAFFDYFDLCFITYEELSMMDC
jgi:hypothetical protein